MANADFSQNKQTAPGGFDAGSYREKAKPEQAVRLTPRQQKLAALEAKLPAAFSTRAAALALSVVVMLAAFFRLWQRQAARQVQHCPSVVHRRGRRRQRL